jgi:hypothetical protein
MGSVRLLGLGCVLLLLAACGGGGGGGGGGNNGNFTIATSTVTFEGDPSAAPPAPQVVTGSITGVNETVFLTVTVTTNGVSSASVDLTGPTTGQLTIFPKAPAQLGFGTFTDTITVRACLDQGCGRQINGSPKTITVTYNVRGFTHAPSNITLSAFEGQASAPVQTTLSNNTTANWTSAITYQGSTTGWLNVAPSGAATQGAQQITFSADALNTPGTYSASVQISGGNRQLAVPVTYTVMPNLGLSETNVSLSAVTGQTAAAVGASVNVTAAAGPTTFTTSVQYGAGAANWLATAGAAAPGAVNVVPQTVALTPGTYTAMVTLTPNGGGTPVSFGVEYTLTASQLTLAPDTAMYAIGVQSTATNQFLQRTIATGDTGAPLTWTAVDNQPWLNVTPAGNSSQNVILTLVPSAIESLRNGNHTAVITFTYNGPSVVNQTKQLTVGLLLNLPSIDFAAPHVAYLNEQKEIVLYGSGFSQAGGAAVTFDGTPAAAVEVVSDKMLRVMPPATEVATASRPLIAITNALGLDRSDTDLVVRTKPNYGNQSFAFTLGIPQYVTHDAERDVVFASRPAVLDQPFETLDHVLRFQLDPTGTAPAVFTKHSFPGLWAIGMSPDGATLHVLTQGQLHFINPVTMLAQKDPVTVPESARLMTVLGDGRILLPNVPTFYSPLTNTFEPINEFLGHAGLATSADGSRVGLQRETGTGKVFFGAYDVATRQFQFQPQDDFSSSVSLNRNGSRIAFGGTVLNAADLTRHGLTDGGYFSSLSPSGDRLYAISFSPSHVGVWDTSASADPFPELTPIDVEFGAAGWGLSLNGEHFFIIDGGHFIVVEL